MRLEESLGLVLIEAQQQELVPVPTAKIERMCTAKHSTVANNLRSNLAYISPAFRDCKGCIKLLHGHLTTGAPVNLKRRTYGVVQSRPVRCRRRQVSGKDF